LARIDIETADRINILIRPIDLIGPRIIGNSNRNCDERKKPSDEVAVQIGAVQAGGDAIVRPVNEPIVQIKRNVSKIA
jgi:hypothetical protein